MQDPALSPSSEGLSALRIPADSSGSNTFSPGPQAPVPASDKTAQMLFAGNKKAHELRAPKTMSLAEYLLKAKKDSTLYDNAHARMSRAIGDPEKIEPHNHPRKFRLFGTGLAAKYRVFDEFHGIETALSEIAEYMRSGGQRQTTSKKILVLVGNVASGKSSIVDRLKELFQQEKFFSLTDGSGMVSPINESPLSLFDPKAEIEDAAGKTTTNAKILESEYNIPQFALPAQASSWVAKRVDAASGDLASFKVTEHYPSMVRQRGIAKMSPAEGRYPDLVLSGKTDETKLQRGELDRGDADSYIYGFYGNANNGLLELAEICQVDPRDLQSLLDATEMGVYKPTEPSIGPLPFSGIVIAHTTLNEWQTFVNAKDEKTGKQKYEGLLSRMHVVKIPYALEATAEEQIYRKELNKSDLAKAPCAPLTLRLAAEFAVLTRMLPVTNKGLTTASEKLPVDLMRKLEIYDGEDPKAGAKEYESIGLMQYRARASIDHEGEREGMLGLSPRWMNTALANTFNYSAAGGGPVEADPVHLFEMLEKGIKEAGFDKDKETKYLGFISEELKPRYKKFITKEIQKYALDNDNRGVSFERYYELLDASDQGKSIREETGELMQQAAIEEALGSFEKPYNISGEKAKEFRSMVLRAVLHFTQHGKKVNEFDWQAHPMISGLIQNKTAKGLDELRSVIEFNKKATEKETNHHEAFVQRMVGGGYTTNQVRTLVTWALKK